jgi:AraC-like DNA-binding protein
MSVMPARIDFSANEVREMHKLYELGSTLAEVGEEFGISGVKVGQIFKKAGLKARTYAQTVALARKGRTQEMYELYEQGISLEQVGRDFGLTGSGVCHLFRQEGLKTRSRSATAALRRKGDTRAFQMYEHYKRGATLAEVAKEFGVSPSRVGQLFAQAGLKTRQATEHPITEMYECYKHGATLAEVGEEFQMTGKQTFAIFKAAGLQTRSLIETLQLKSQADYGRAEEIVEAFRKLDDRQLVADELDIPLSTVTTVLKELMPAGEYHARIIAGKRSSRFSDEELFGFLRYANSTLGGVLSAKNYGDFARNRDTADGRHWPTKETHIRRFGTWRKAVLAAGLDANGPLKIAKERAFTASDCLKAIRVVHSDLGRVPTRTEYASRVQRSNGTLPGLAIIARRCGNWTQTLHMAGL